MNLELQKIAPIQHDAFAVTMEKLQLYKRMAHLYTNLVKQLRSRTLTDITWKICKYTDVSGPATIRLYLGRSKLGRSKLGRNSDGEGESAPICHLKRPRTK